MLPRFFAAIIATHRCECVKENIKYFAAALAFFALCVILNVKRQEKDTEPFVKGEKECG